MTHRPFFQKPVALALFAALAVQLTSCGTLMYPERRGQTGGRIDPSIAILDGIGLLFFIVPGLVAYAIDFSSGAIYLPPGRSSTTANEDGIVVVQTKPGGPSKAELQEILENHTGREVDFANTPVEAAPLEDTEEFLPRYAQLVESGVVPSTNVAAAATP